MLRAPSLACVGSCVLAVACGRAITDLDAPDTDPTDAVTTTGDGPDDADGPASSVDLPEPELGCEAQGGRLAQVSEPWVLQSHILDHPPVYGVLPGDDGMLVMWRGPFLGTAPLPNLLGMRVGYDGVPTSAVDPVWERPVLIEPSVHRAADAGGWVVTYCGRFDAYDEVTSQVIDATGAELRAETRREPDSNCGAARPEGVWTGQRYLFAWVDNSSNELYVDVADESLLSVGWERIEPDGNLSCPPRLAVGPTGVLMVAGVSNDAVWAYDLALDGSRLGERSIPLPEGYTPGKLAVGVGSDGGFTIVLADRWNPGLWVTRLVDGTLTMPVPVAGAQARYSDSLLLQRPGGLLLVTEANYDGGITRVEAIVTDEHGEAAQVEPLGGGEPPLWEAGPAAAVHGDGAWVAYYAGLQDGTFDVRLVELGCVR